MTKVSATVERAIRIYDEYKKTAAGVEEVMAEARARYGGGSRRGHDVRRGSEGLPGWKRRDYRWPQSKPKKAKGRLTPQPPSRKKAPVVHGAGTSPTHPGVLLVHDTKRVNQMLCCTLPRQISVWCGSTPSLAPAGRSVCVKLAPCISMAEVLNICAAHLLPQSNTPPQCLYTKAGIVVDSIDDLHGEEEYILLPRGFPYSTASIPETLRYKTTNVDPTPVQPSGAASRDARDASVGDDTTVTAAAASVPAESATAAASAPESSPARTSECASPTGSVATKAPAPATPAAASGSGSRSRRRPPYPACLSPKSAVHGAPTLAESESRLGGHYDLTVWAAPQAQADDRGRPATGAAARRGLFTITHRGHEASTLRDDTPVGPLDDTGSGTQWAEQWAALFGAEDVAGAAAAASPSSPGTPPPQHPHPPSLAPWSQARGSTPQAQPLLPQQLTPAAPTLAGDGSRSDAGGPAAYQLRTTPAHEVPVDEWAAGAFVALLVGDRSKRPSSPGGSDCMPLSRPSSAASAPRLCSPLDMYAGQPPSAAGQRSPSPQEFSRPTTSSGTVPTDPLGQSQTYTLPRRGFFTNRSPTPPQGDAGSGGGGVLRIDSDDTTPPPTHPPQPPHTTGLPWVHSPADIHIVQGGSAPPCLPPPTLAFHAHPPQHPSHGSTPEVASTGPGGGSGRRDPSASVVELWMVQFVSVVRGAGGSVSSAARRGDVVLHARRVRWGDTLPFNLRDNAAFLTDECTTFAPGLAPTSLALVLNPPPCLWWTDGRRLKSLASRYRAGMCVACGEDGHRNAHIAATSHAHDPYAAEVEAVMAPHAHRVGGHSPDGLQHQHHSHPPASPSGRVRSTPDILVSGGGRLASIGSESDVSEYGHPQSFTPQPFPTGRGGAGGGAGGLAVDLPSPRHGPGAHSGADSPAGSRRSSMHSVQSGHTGLPAAAASPSPMPMPVPEAAATNEEDSPKPLRSALKRRSSLGSKSRKSSQPMSVASPSQGTATSPSISTALSPMASPQVDQLMDVGADRTTHGHLGSKRFDSMHRRSLAQESLATVGRYLVPLRKCVDSWMTDTHEHDMHTPHAAHAHARQAPGLSLDDDMESVASEGAGGEKKRVTWSDAAPHVMYFEKVDEVYDPQEVSDDESESDEEGEEEDHDEHEA